MKLSSILEVYSLQDILELNDLTDEDCLDFLVTQDFVKLPDILPLDYD